MECLGSGPSGVETGGVSWVCLLRTLDWVRQYETADGVFIQGGVVGALTWIRLETVEVQGRRSKAGTRFGRTYKAGARDYSSSFFLETTRDYWFDGGNGLLSNIR